MAFGDVDTLGLTFDKLQYIFNGYDQIRDSFLELGASYKQEKITYAEFFDKIQEGVMRFSALEFLAIKAIFEIKKSIDRRSGITKDVENMDSRVIRKTPSSGHSVDSFIITGTLSRPEQISSGTIKTSCLQCGVSIRVNANFCTNCGKKA
ncbi:MAG: zinc ribbon domain-containing protein [Thaumarchaeota archaeon]|nr:zinc ribbon domain-containing protein [Nitrososphaerota archaeon]